MGAYSLPRFLIKATAIYSLIGGIVLSTSRRWS
jgi:hypothetical protein